MQDWKDKYGNIVGVRIGLSYHVFINDYELLKKTFAMETSTGRPENFCQLITAGLAREPGESPVGISFTEGKLWAEQRQIVANFLGRRSNYMSHIFANARKLVDRLNSKIVQRTGDFEGEELADIFNARVISVIHQLLIGGDADDEKSKHVLHWCEPFVALESCAELLIMIPWLRHVVHFSKCFDFFKRGPQLIRAIQYKALGAHRQAGTESMFMKHYMSSL